MAPPDPGPLMPRIEPLRDPDEEQQKLLAKSLAGPDGRPLNLWSTLVRRPELMKRLNALGGYFFVGGEVETRERELVILRVAGTTESPYEIGQHRWIGGQAGLSDAEISAAIDPDQEHPWSSADRALLDFADELLRTDNVSDAVWNGVEGDDQLRLELVLLVGFYRLLAGALNTLQVDLDESVAAFIEAGD